MMLLRKRVGTHYGDDKDWLPVVGTYFINRASEEQKMALSLGEVVAVYLFGHIYLYRAKAGRKE